jgi:putative flippase GtrA
MTDNSGTVAEAGLAARFAGVGLIGLAIDATLLKIGLSLHLTPAVARLISLALAMQVTFTINRVLVFHCAEKGTLLRHWGGYMLTNGFGNFCNYWIFLTLGSLHGSPVSRPFVALPISAFAAYLINYAGVRLVVFGRDRTARRAALKPGPGAVT